MLRNNKGESSLDVMSAGRVLIVEDQVIDIYTPQMIFKNLGFDVRLAFDGQSAISELCTDFYNYIILDWNMPYLAGEGFLRTLSLKKDARLRLIEEPKIIIHSGSQIQIEKFESSSGYQIVDYWKKPMGVLDMVQRFNSLRKWYG